MASEYSSLGPEAIKRPRELYRCKELAHLIFTAADLFDRA
jgi:hypothetical protein